MIIYWIFFGIGFAATLSQVILLREFLVGSLGNEVAFGVGFAMWLVGIMLGAWGGAFLGRRRGAAWSFRLAAGVWSLLPVGLLVLVRVSRAWYPVGPGEIPSPQVMLLFAALCILPAGFLIGVLFPLGSVLVSPSGKERKSAGGSTRGIGMVYVYEAAGCLLGGGLFSIILALHYHPVTYLALGGLAVMVLLGVAEFQKKLTKGWGRWVVPAVCGAALIALLVPAVGRPVERASRSVRTAALFPGLEPIDWAESKYQNLELLRLNEQYTLFASGHQAFSFPNQYGPTDTADLVLTEHPNPKNVLLVGTRPPELLAAMLRHNVEDIEAVDLDPRILELVKPSFTEDAAKVYNDARLALQDEDGRRYLLTEGFEYDVVFVNVPDPLTAFLGRYYTREFFEGAKGRLAEGGLLVFTFTGTPLFAGEEAFDYGGIVYRTAGEVFDHVLAVRQGSTVFVFCSREPDVFTRDPEVLEARYVERGILPKEAALRFHDLLWPDEVERLNRILEKTPKEWISTDWHPRAYFHASLLWDRFVKARTVALFRAMMRVPLWAWPAGLLVIFLIRLGIRAARRKPDSSALGDLAWSIATTGLAALALEIMFIFAFQNIYGYVYEKLGLVVGLFMLGLAIGGNWGTERFSGRTPKGGRIGFHRTMTVLDLLVAGAAVLFLGFVWLCGHLFSASELLFYLYLAGLGGLTGIQFPLAARCRLEIRQDTAGTAGVLDAADHLGAALGALLTGVFLVPVYGIAGPVIILAVLKLGTAGFQCLDSRVGR